MKHAATPGTPEHVIAAARDAVESDGDPEFMAFLAAALRDYDDVVAAERAWVGEWPYALPGGMSPRGREVTRA